MERKKQKNYKYFGILFLAVICLITVVGILLKWRDVSAEQIADVPVQNSDQEQETEAIQTIEGTIEDATMNTLTIKAQDGSSYSFGTVDVEVSVGETGILIGNPVSISFRGELNSSAIGQNVELVSVTVRDKTAEETYPIETTHDEIVPDNNASEKNLEEQAKALLEQMTLEEKVGQMFIVRCPGSDAAAQAAEYHLGGYILFGKDFEGKTKDEVISEIQSYQDKAEIPLFIGVDEEGGTVNRVSINRNLRAVPFLSPQELYAEGGFELIQRDTKEKCELLRSLGINLNFAPVCDVSQNSNDFMYNRSFGQGTQQTAEYVRSVVEVMEQEGMGSVLKHFPGYGNNEDTHMEICYDNRSYESFKNSDFIPFMEGINSGADMVLVSHNIVNCMDSQYPASLSGRVHQILREELGFAGVIITDDLLMEGVRNFASDDEIAVMAVQAGNDLLCCTDFETQIPAVLKAVESGILSEERIDESVLRILKLKLFLGI